QYYLEENCDIVVLEVGMGGEFDSTNVIDAPEVAVLTNIGLEHTEYLGSTIEEIAHTKSGIIKPGCKVVSYDNVPEVKAIISEVAKENGAPLVFADPSGIRLVSRDLDGQVFEWEGKTYRLPLHGEHQLRNASVVMEIVRELREQGWDISDEAVRRGLAEVKWPARFQILSRDPLFILDGGHNPQCAEAMTESLDALLPGQKVDFLLGILADKDYTQMIDILSPYAASFHCIAPENERALGVEALADTIRARGFETYAYNDLDEAIRAVCGSAAANNRPAVCFGSLYLAGEVLNYCEDCVS
ncbi:MAG: bifunctional folylpolyglutamate synthase/dihydrofolate synthase, partial [Mogibacterium sp.]|nr:bifunctional folylpolyglutamate synthase/dihydrofolate synthase [Mogibacterium sp.]